MAEELGVDVYDLGSTTFEREDLERGFEPDSCFYIQNEERIRGKDRINLEVDPLPDLVIEMTSPALRWTSCRSTRGSESRRSGATTAEERRSSGSKGPVTPRATGAWSFPRLRARPPRALRR